MKRFSLVFVTLILLASASYGYNKKLLDARKEVKVGNCKKAQNILLNLIQRKPDSTTLAEAYFLLAKCAQTLSKANHYYKSIIRLPSNRFTKLAKLYYAKNQACEDNFEEAKIHLEHIISEPEIVFTAEANFIYAQICYQEKDYQKAITFYEEYLVSGKNTSKMITSLLNIGNSYFNLRNYDAARKNFNNLLNYALGDKIESYIFYKIAQSFEKEKEYKKASEYYHRIVDQHPYSPEYESAENRIIELAENGMSFENTNKNTTSPPTANKYFVQLAAYRDKERARNMHSAYVGQDIHTVVYDKTVNGVKYYCVGIGPYFSELQALKKKQELQRQDIKSFIYIQTNERK